VEGWQSG